MVKVRALERGYYAGVVRDEGEVFDFDGPGKRPNWTELVAFGGKGDHDGDGLTGGSLPADDDKPVKGKAKPAAKGKAKTVEAETAEPFSDAPEPMTSLEAQKAAGGIEPDWVPKEHQPVAVTD